MAIWEIITGIDKTQPITCGLKAIQWVNLGKLHC